MLTNTVVLVLTLSLAAECLRSSKKNTLILKMRASLRHRQGMRRPRANAHRGAKFFMERVYIVILDLKRIYIAISARKTQTFTRFQPINRFTFFLQHSSISSLHPKVSAFIFTPNISLVKTQNFEVKRKS